MIRICILTMFVIACLLLSGCTGWLSGHANIITTTTFPDGRIEVQQEFTDDGLFYVTKGDIKKAIYAAARCDECSPGEKIGLLAVAGLSDDGELVKAMNGYEFANSTLSMASPYALGAFAVDRLTKRPASVTLNGDNAVYAPFETHVTGSSGATTTVPYRYDSPDTPTTTTSTSTYPSTY